MTLDRKIRKNKRYMKRFVKYNLKVDNNAKQFLIGRSSCIKKFFFIQLGPESKGSLQIIKL